MKNSRPLPLGSRSQSYGSRPVDLDAKTSFPKGANPNNNRATVVTRGFDTDRRTPSGTYRTFNLLLCRSLCRRLARARPPSPARSTRQHRNSHARGHVAGTSALPAPAGCVQVFPLRSCARAHVRAGAAPASAPRSAGDVEAHLAARPPPPHAVLAPVAGKPVNVKVACVQCWSRLECARKFRIHPRLPAAPRTAKRILISQPRAVRS